ncbi:rod shape-determining protein MreC [Helcococcus sueciensis]|uniref:rod shape-determining protein MreC n=1 Tax=Helcococcus sueciensis TaxID=241555 RepID=UPI0003FB6F37|nr:rod shape-determining protein MreC [Helcococcus sueciensis]
MLYYNKNRVNKKHIIRVLVLFSLILLTSINPDASRIGSRVYSFITKPITLLTTKVSKVTTDAIDAVIGTKPNRDMVNKLTKENEELKSKVNNLEFVLNNQEYLKQSIKFKELTNTLNANLIMIDNDSKFSQFMIDKGSLNGVNIGDEIISSYGSNETNTLGSLVGRVIEVNETTSVISSIYDDKYNITFEHGKSNTIGVIRNRNNGYLEGYMLNKADIKVGDSVYTSGTGGLYQRGLYLGKITEVKMSQDGLNQLVTILSPVNFAKLYEVFVLRGDN